MTRAISIILMALGISAGPAWAEPVPLPRVDYAAAGTLAGKGKLTVRHHASKLRAEVVAAGATVTGFINLKSRKSVMVVPGAKTAMELNFSGDASFGHVAGDGVRTGTAIVAGESCALWQIKAKKVPVEACITADGITLQTEISVEGKRRKVLEVTELRRVPQDPALFTVPADVKVVKPAEAIKGLLGALPSLTGRGDKPK